MHVALTPKLCAKQRNGDPLRWNDRLIAFNELFWHGAVRGALSQIKVIWHDPSEPSAPVHLEHASVCLRGVWYLCWCLYFWSEEVGLTHLMERNVQRRQRHTRCFQLLSFDSDIQGWVMVLRKDHLPKNEWQEKSSRCVSKRKHIWVRHWIFHMFQQPIKNCIPVCICPFLTRLSVAESPSCFRLLDLVNESNNFSRTVSILTWRHHRIDNKHLLAGKL